MNMDDLSQRMQRLNRNLPAGVVKGSDLLRQQSVEKELPDLSRFIPGEVREVEGESCFVSEEWFPYDRLFGAYPLGKLQSLTAQTLIDTFHLDKRESLSWISPSKILFLDTETTGLAGGTGTYAFMIGIGSIEAEGFRVIQYFMRDYDEESAQMHLLAEELKAAAVIVTYNGNSFDLPLLKTRFVFNRIRLNLGEIPHLDLLPMARRLWKPTFGAANLSFLEAKVLLNEREGDIPGSLIPHVYFQFLRGASPRTIVPIFYHNRMDIVALAALTESAWHCLLHPEEIRNPWERYGVAQFLVKVGQLTQAIEVLEPAVWPSSETLSEGKLGREQTSWQACARILALLYKTLKQREQAGSLWWCLYNTGVFDPFVSLELAKHLEHFEKDYAKAREVVLEIFTGYDRSPSCATVDETVSREALLATPDEDEIQYDYSEWFGTKREESRSININGEYEEERQANDSRSIPRWTEKMEQELNHRLQRLERRIEMSRS